MRNWKEIVPHKKRQKYFWIKHFHQIFAFLRPHKKGVGEGVRIAENNDMTHKVAAVAAVKKRTMRESLENSFMQT